MGLTDLGTLGGTFSVANAVNATGQVVGYSSTAGNAANHAFFYSGGQMVDLNSLIAPGSGITLVSANGIDAAGDIVGYGTDSGGHTRAFLLTAAVPEPCSLAMAGLGLAGVAGARWRMRRRA